VIDPATALRIDGRAVLVTGGTRGIGRAIAEAGAAAGADICVVARKPAELDETVAALSALGTKVIAVAGSVGDPDIATTAVQAMMDAFGRCDVVVNNAAINPVFGPLMDADLGAVTKVFDANISAPLRFARAAWHAYMHDHGGVVLNVASVGGLRPGPFLGAYNVSKAALIHLTRQLAQELAPSVRVNAILSWSARLALLSPKHCGKRTAIAGGRFPSPAPPTIRTAMMFQTPLGRLTTGPSPEGGTAM